MNYQVSSNGVGSSIATVCSVLSSLDGAPTSPFTQAGRSDGYMKKQYKESSYSKKLRDPRWQKKRLDIMQRDKFACTHCESSTETLNVHHCYYDAFGKYEPWEYPDGSLLTLCEDCHEKETGFLKVMRNGFQTEMGKHGATSLEYYELAMAISKVEPGRLHAFIMFVGFMADDKQLLSAYYADLDKPSEDDNGE